tara:strand:- start:795 stop:6233 length:5439 start_codon:yes stop_codon:yes gene_type:complete
MGSDQSTTANPEILLTVETLRNASTMPHHVLLKTLKQIETESEYISVRKLVILNPDYVRELLRVIKDCELKSNKNVREYEVHMMNSLRKCAFRVLIALTNSLDVIGSVEERILQACDADVDSDDEVIEERIKEEEAQHSQESPSIVSTSNIGWGSSSAHEPHIATISANMSEHEQEQYTSTRGTICRLIGTPSALRFYLSKTTSTNAEESSLAVLLLSNVTSGGGSKVSCKLSSYLLSPLLSRANLTSKNELTISTATAAYKTMGILLQHPAFEEDRILAFDTRVKEHEFDVGEHESKAGGDGGSGSGSTTHGSGGGDSGDGGDGGGVDGHDHSENIPFADTYENHTHEHLLQLGLVESMMTHISYGLPDTALMLSILECLFHMFSGGNLMFMYKDKEAHHRIDTLRNTCLSKQLLLQYDPKYEYDLFTVHKIHDTTLLDFLQWTTAEVKLPSWAKEFQSKNEEHLPYPWNIVVVSKNNPTIQIAAMKVLRVLVASIHSLDHLVSTSLNTDVKIGGKYKKYMHRSIKDCMELGKTSDVAVADAGGDGDVDNDVDDHEDSSVNNVAEDLNSSNDSSNDIVDSDSDSDDVENNYMPDEEDDYGSTKHSNTHDHFHQNHEDNDLSDGSISADSDNSDDDREKWENYNDITQNPDISTQIVNDLKKFRHTGIISHVLERIDKKRRNGKSTRQLTVALQRGVTKNWHLRLIQRAVTANRGGRTVLGSANLIGMIRKLAAREYRKHIMLIEARHELREQVFGLIKESKTEHFMTVVKVEELNMSHLTITAQSVASNRWKAMRHFVRLHASAKELNGEDQHYTERLYYTVSTGKNRHTLPPLWELLPPEQLMAALGTPSTYTIEFGEGNLGLVFSSTKHCGNNHGVSISNIEKGSQADLGQHGNISIGDQLNRVNGESVRGPGWNKRKVIACIKQSPRPLLLSFSGNDVKRFAEELHETTPTKRWTPGCEDSVWEEPADSLFRIVRVRVCHKMNVTLNDINTGKVVPLDGGSGLLQDNESDIVDAYIVEVSPIIKHTVYNKGTTKYNINRIKERFIQLAKKRTADQVILETFASGFGTSRKIVDGDRGLLWISENKQSRLGLLHNNIGTHRAPEVAYYSALTILQLLITAHLQSTSNAGSVSLLDLFRGDAQKKVPVSNTQESSTSTTNSIVEGEVEEVGEVGGNMGITPGELLRQILMPGLTNATPDNRGHLSAMYASRVILNVAKLVKRMNVSLAKRTVILLVPTVTYILDRFKQFDDISRRHALLAVAQMSYRSDPTCAKILWEGKCYHAIVKANKMLCSRATKLALVGTLVAGCVHLPLKDGMRNELQLISLLKRLTAEMKYLETEDSETIEFIKTQAILGKGNVCQIPYYMSPHELMRSSFGSLIQEIVIIVENSTNSIDRWKALGALANFTKATNACQLIVKKHQTVLVNITRYAQTHDMQFGIFGATLGQLEAVQIMANMSMCPGSLVLWCQFSEGHKLAMDYTGNTTPAIPLEAADALQPSFRTRCSKCAKLYQDEHNARHDVSRTCDWYRLGHLWFCGHCYAKKVPGRRPAWIYREEEGTLANWKRGGKHAYLNKNNGNEAAATEYHPAFVPGTMVRIRSNAVYGGKEGVVVQVHESLTQSDVTETKDQNYVVKIGDQEVNIAAKNLIYQVRPALPPLRWGARFGKRSMIFLSREGMQLPQHGWSISVWFRSGSWIKELSSNGRFLTLCESSEGDKIIALDHEMRLGSYESSNDNNEGNAWHSSNFKLNRIGSQHMRNMLGLNNSQSLSTEEKWMHLVVSATPGRESATKSVQPSMIYYLNGVVVSTVRA